MTNSHLPIIDFHTHAFNDELAGRVMQEMEAQTKFKAYFDGTISGLLSNMAKTGIEQSVIQPVATKPQQVRPINQWVDKIKSDNRLIGFGAIHPNMSKLAIEDELDFLKQHQIKGIKLHPEYQGFFPDDDRLAFLYEQLAANQFILMIHSGRDLCFSGEIKATPKRLKEINLAYPELKLVLAHLGGFQQWDAVQDELVGSKLWLDTAYCAGYIEPKQFEQLVSDHGSDYILFGSDAPWGDQARHLEFINNANIGSEEKHRILGMNALQLLA